MKRYMIFALLIIVMSCKKKEVKPSEESIKNVCETKTKVFEGSYEAQSDTRDTITIVFIKNNCPTEGVNTYSVYGLGRAYNRALNKSLDESKVYEIVSNESQNLATTTGVNCKWGIPMNLSVDYGSIGVLIFKKL